MSAFAPEALARTLAEHTRRYPLMEAADAVKLCHQAAFGAAHFCAGEAEALAALIAESAPVAPDAAAQPSRAVTPGLYTASNTAAVRERTALSTGIACVWGYIPTGVALISRSKSPSSRYSVVR